MELDNETFFDEKAKVRELDAQHDLPEAPICKVWGWVIRDDPYWGHKPPWLWADCFEDHPRLGRGIELRTTTVIWLSRELGMARTRNTLYKLMGPERK